MKSVSIVIPCYNEENNLKRGVLDQVSDFLKDQKYEWEVIIANDESTDGSKKLVEEFIKKHKGFRLLNLPHGGKPSAVWGGIQEAKNPIVLFTDMDQSTPLSQLNKLLPYFDEGYDVVIGSRGSHRSGNSLIRKIMAKGFLLGRQLVLLPGIVDTQCGFKAMKTDVAKLLFPKLQFFQEKGVNHGWRVSAFDVELLFMASKAKFKLKEVEVEWRNEDTSTTKGDDASRFKKESVQMAKEVVRVIYNNLTGKYENIRN